MLDCLFCSWNKCSKLSRNLACMLRTAIQSMAQRICKVQACITLWILHICAFGFMRCGMPLHGYAYLLILLVLSPTIDFQDVMYKDAAGHCPACSH